MSLRAPRFLEEIPEGYRVETRPGAMLAVRRDAEGALRAAGYGPDSDGGVVESGLAGRGPLLELATPQGIFLVRRFTHGGLLRFLTGARFRDPSRPFRELCAAQALARLGVLSPDVVAARARAARPWGWRLEVVTRCVEGAIDVEEVLALARRGEVDRRALSRIAAAAGDLVHRLHAGGFLHADLTPKNMLVGRAALAGGEPRLWVLDLDRARIVAEAGPRERRASLRRLFRFVDRGEARGGRALGRTDYARFLRAYDAEPKRWKELWREVLCAHERSLFWHAIGWRLERMAGSGTQAGGAVTPRRGATSRAPGGSAPPAPAATSRRAARS